MSRDSVQKISAVAVEFLAAAFEALYDDGVIPPSRYHPHLRVGHDYQGPVIMALTEFGHLEELLVAGYQDRFDRPLGRRHAEFPNQYIFSFLEEAVARLALKREPFDASSVTSMSCIDELIDALGSADHPIVCVRMVSHLTTADGRSTEIGGVTVVPIMGRHATEILHELVPKAWSAFNRDPPFTYAPPESFVVARGAGVAPFEVAHALSRQIDRFLLSIRLLFGGTAESIYEVSAETRSIRILNPRMELHRHDSHPLIRRTTRISDSDAQAVTAFQQMLEALPVDRADKAVTSFDMALLKFTDTYTGSPWYEQLVDLATALEAIISGTDKQDVGLRIRNRAASLLSCGNDSATAIFEDLKRLYEIRSSLVHGNSITRKKVEGIMQGLDGMPNGLMSGDRVAFGVDRLRDLVRRAILARVALGKEPGAIWPFGLDPGVDVAMTDDAQRERWRSIWRNAYSEIEAPIAADRAAAAVDALKDDAPDLSQG